jgi:hypothetical protein
MPDAGSCHGELQQCRHMPPVMLEATGHSMSADASLGWRSIGGGGTGRPARPRGGLEPVRRLNR